MKKAFLPPYVKVEKFSQFDVIATSGDINTAAPDTPVWGGGDDDI